MKVKNTDIMSLILFDVTLFYLESYLYIINYYILILLYRFKLQ